MCVYVYIYIYMYIYIYITCVYVYVYNIYPGEYVMYVYIYIRIPCVDVYHMYVYIYIPRDQTTVTTGLISRQSIYPEKVTHHLNWINLSFSRLEPQGLYVYVYVCRDTHDACMVVLHLCAFLWGQHCCNQVT